MGGLEALNVLASLIRGVLGFDDVPDCLDKDYLGFSHIVLTVAGALAVTYSLFLCLPEVLRELPIYGKDGLGISFVQELFENSSLLWLWADVGESLHDPLLDCS